VPARACWFNSSRAQLKQKALRPAGGLFRFRCHSKRLSVGCSNRRRTPLGERSPRRRPRGDRGAHCRPPSGYPTSHYKTLGWILLANGKKAEARAAFEKAIEPLKQPDGSYDFAKATCDHLTAAYFLDMISEERYLDRFAKKDVVKWGENQDVNVSFPWFYIGQRREIEGKRAAAIEAYKHSVETASRTPHPTFPPGD
jgi:hypothetical protein